MEISLIPDTVTVAANHGLGFAKSLLNRNKHLSLSDSSSPETLQILAVIFPVDTVAPPPVKSKFKTAPRKLSRKSRRTKRRSMTGGGPQDGGFFGDDGDGPFGGGGGGSGWNFGGRNWDDDDDGSSSGSLADPAFDFLYEMISWIVFSNCLHFAFKKVVRIVADGIGDPAREKVPVC